MTGPVGVGSASAAHVVSTRREHPTWPPSAGTLPSPEATAAVSAVDRPADTGSVGLQTFNLGYIPASVTPPKTWRRAAWFAIFSSGAALVGLVFVTSVMVGPVHVASDINSLPGLPTGLPFFTPPSASDPGPPAGHHPISRVGQSRRHRGGLPASAGTAGGARTSGDAAATSGNSSQTSGVPVSVVVTTAPSTPPTVTTVNTGPPAVDPNKIGSRTEQFFGEVTSNVDAAASLTSDTVRGDAKAIIEQNYGDISSIKIKSISLDPRDGMTVSVLQVTNKDGSVSTQQRTLQFTLTGDPKIENPGG